MPMYEYECEACHRRTEKIQKFSDAPLTICPHCGEPRLERTITAPAFQFAGGGWYKDGYGNAKPADKPGSETKPSGDTAPAISAAASDSSSAPSAPAPPSTPAATPAPASTPAPTKP